jgi:hypothetical protein
MSLIALGLFTLVACSQTLSVSIEIPTPITSATPPVTATGEILASPTPWVGGTETALAAPTVAEIQSQVVIEKPTDFSPVLYGGTLNETSFFLLLGGASQDIWLAPYMSVSRFSGEVTYSLHTLTQESKYFVWGKAPKISPTCQAYSVATDAALDETGFVGVVDGWAITKRPVTEIAPNEQYQEVVMDWLSAEGVSAPEVDRLQVHRVDIEGDGVDEVFVSATHLDASQHTTKAGDYSIVLMRQVIGNEALTKLVLGDIYRSQEPELTYPRAYSLANFIDLNQDGRLEVVVDVRKWEGFGARVLQIDGEDVIQTLGTEC